jgi:KaiC/GvpD/RAD55 family RecA-like ATPase
MVERLKKVSSGIKGLDELTGGGLPAGRPTLVCGGPGCGKTLPQADTAVAAYPDARVSPPLRRAG